MSEKQINVDPGEIAKFEQLAHRWWDQKGEFKPLHDINPLRLEYIRSRCSLAGKRVLDVGCGGGILTEELARLGAKVTGIDLSEAPLTVARLHALEGNLKIDYRQISVEQLTEAEAESFDVVTNLEMLEHVPDPASIIAACGRLLKPHGKVFFSTLNRTLKAYLFAIIGAEYTLQLLPKGTHDYQRFIQPAELEAWCRAAGLELQDLTGLHYNPLTHRYWLGHDINVNYLAYGIKME
ncbi:bifunctional 2-polyprenyl-6-hydroxyphenol methylase/3-demethylubiquinol 3-O-methyltransferase UbiG [Nitrosococcus wardiae]|uniref:Ubiquinone biosynthesis O-methyltransferase n=1 Tax=Nitrosococcus wardiae TaxID=1814290 RepID=A0A4P7BZP7_9GAMM|nr:bifunctional 2-polyprenyl-6-hydroxyphenol methylase/3-demethylubiquinol 3-O-methyltransferase UbiG [Nitrosococcus wardiae]QBQ54684.1 bifunctional 2-polyprenyl-6-hydroxyphenol methylase/3-demethylubiquinol 3-O-methyltransferase UbiG [Nitrosococcus wardiae]